jgi:hypothetical protein
MPAKPGKPRRPKRPKYKSLRLQKRIKHHIKLPSVYRITKKAVRTVWDQKALFLGITFIYGFLNLVLVQGIAGSTDTSVLKEGLDEIFTGNLGGLASSLSIFSIMLSSAGNSTSQTAGAYQMFLALIGSLAIIWALREVLAGKNVRIRDAFYRGMYPLIPFILIMFVIALQIIPILVGSGLYSIVVNNGIAVLFVEKFLWAMLYGLLGLLTLYMLSSSIFALYIVTLPDMTPVKALRSARELVRYRRWTILRKIISLPIILLITAAVIMVPIIIWLTPLAQWVFFMLTMSALLAIHAYMYTLYRELLND